MASPVTLTMTVHELLAATVPPERLTELEVSGVVPPHVLDRFEGLATCNPVGKLSVKATPVSATPFGFEMVKVRLVVPWS